MAVFQDVMLNSTGTLYSEESIATIRGALTLVETSEVFLQTFSLLQQIPGGSLFIGDAAIVSVQPNTLAFIDMDSTLESTASISVQSSSLVLGSDYLIDGVPNKKTLSLKDQTMLSFQNGANVALAGLDLHLIAASQITVSGGANLMGASLSGVFKNITLQDTSQISIQSGGRMAVTDNTATTLWDATTLSITSGTMEVGQTSLTTNSLRNSAPATTYIKVST